MGGQGAVTAWDETGDTAYPEETPADPVFPGQTLAPLCPVLEGVALPSIWSRLQSPLRRSLDQLWQVAGLSDRGRPSAWVGLHWGRIAINAHGWERLRAALSGEEPDPSLVGPAPRGLAGWSARLEMLRVRWYASRVARRLALAQQRAAAALDRLSALDVRSIDTPPLARGPLDEWTWSELMLPWLVLRIRGESSAAETCAVERALAIEQRFTSELGRRLVDAGVLHRRGDVAYLTIDERIQAVVDGSGLWMRVVAARVGRVEHFSTIEVPERFWGRARIDRAPELVR